MKAGRSALGRPWSRVTAAFLGGLLLLAMVEKATARTVRNVDFSPGFGLIYGEGRTDNGATITRFGFTSRRLKENKRMGSLALLGEEHTGGLPFEILATGISRDNVSLKYQSIFLEVKRYFPLWTNFYFYWGIRGGFTRLSGRIDPGGGLAITEFEEDQIAPLALLALPLALENPGFMLLAFIDGTSAGLTFDIIPGRVWLDYQISTVLIPPFRDASIALDESMMVTQMLQLAFVF